MNTESGFAHVGRGCVKDGRVHMCEFDRPEPHSHYRIRKQKGRCCVREGRVNPSPKKTSKGRTGGLLAFDSKIRVSVKRLRTLRGEYGHSRRHTTKQGVVALEMGLCALVFTR